MANDATITLSLMDNGPILVSGDFKIMLPNGQEVPVEGETVALCRCGASTNKPFCDGRHKEIGFKSGSNESAQ